MNTPTVCDSYLLCTSSSLPAALTSHVYIGESLASPKMRLSIRGIGCIVGATRAITYRSVFLSSLMKLILIATLPILLAAIVLPDETVITPPPPLTPAEIRTLFKKRTMMTDRIQVKWRSPMLEVYGSGCTWKIPYLTKPLIKLMRKSIREVFPRMCFDLGEARGFGSPKSGLVEPACDGGTGSMTVNIRFAKPETKSVYYEHNNGKDFMSRDMCELLLAVRATIDKIAETTTLDATGAGAEIARLIAEDVARQISEDAAAKDRDRREAERKRLEAEHELLEAERMRLEHERKRLEAEHAAAAVESEKADAYLGQRYSAMWSIATGPDEMDTMKLWYRETDCALHFTERSHPHAESHDSYASGTTSVIKDSKTVMVVDSRIFMRFIDIKPVCGDGRPAQIYQTIWAFEEENGGFSLIAERDRSGITCKGPNGAVLAKYKVGPGYIPVLNRMQRRLMEDRPNPPSFGTLSYPFRARRKADIVNEFLCIKALIVRGNVGRSLRVPDREWELQEEQNRQRMAEEAKEKVLRQSAPRAQPARTTRRNPLKFETLSELGDQDLFLPPAEAVGSADHKGFIESESALGYRKVSLEVDEGVCKWEFSFPPGTRTTNIEALNSQFPKGCLDPEKLRHLGLPKSSAIQVSVPGSWSCYPTEFEDLAVEYTYPGEGDRLNFPICSFLMRIRSLVLRLNQQHLSQSESPTDQHSAKTALGQ